MFACLYVPSIASGPVQLSLRAADRDCALDIERASRSDLAGLAREFSPRVEVHRPGLVTLDAGGLERLFGDAQSLGTELRRACAERGLPARIALAGTRATAWLIVHARAGLTIVPAGQERKLLSPLSLHVFEQIAANGLIPEAHFDFGVLKRWGLKTLGEFAALSSLELSERLGQEGLVWQQLARGDEMVPLVPDAPEERFEETVDLEWPVEGLQPLSFVFGRLFDALSARLAARDRAASVLHIHLQLVNREVERRSLQLPAPMREARVLRTLALLNLEAHPVAAGIDRVTVIADPVPGRVVQSSLLTRALPFPEQMSTLLARLGAVMGEGRCGMAALVDSYRPGAFDLQPFPVVHDAPKHASHGAARTAHFAPPASKHSCVLRRFRIPIPASVSVNDGRPVRLFTERQGLRCGAVEACAGPWRTSGEWWRVSDARVEEQASRPVVGWNRDEWDVSVGDGAIYRIYRDRDRDRWFIDGVID